MRPVNRIWLTVALGFVGVAACAAKVITVCPDGTGDYVTIQEAIDHSSDGDVILLCPWVYTGLGNKNLDFGGRKITVRGEMGAQNTIIDCENSGRGFYFHGSENSSSVVEGLTIRRGRATFDDGAGIRCVGGSSPLIVNCKFEDNYSLLDGGAIACQGSSPSIINCLMMNNSTVDTGGGVYCAGGSSPRIINCTIIGNTAGNGGGGVDVARSAPTVVNCTFDGNRAAVHGGGMYVRQSNPTLAKCTFMHNTASDNGGGIYNEESQPQVASCMFVDNWATDGGGMYNYISTPLVVNCAFIANRVSGGVGSDGGGMRNAHGSSPTVTNCTFSGNTAQQAGGGMANAASSYPVLTNCILWGNSDAGGSDESAQIHDEPDSAATVSYSCIQGCTKFCAAANHNIGADPRFVDAANGDLRLRPHSPCIDAAENSALPPDTLDLDGDGDTTEPLPLDLTGQPRFVDDPTTPDTGSGTPPVVDMGAYEWQVPVVPVDMKPGSCPNSLNVKSRGVLPAAILGTEVFDVSTIDPSTVRLSRADGIGGSVAPIDGPPGPSPRVEDVGTPFDGEPCDCHALAGDGVPDLHMAFRTSDIVSALQLGELEPGALVELVMSGGLLDGTPFTGADCVRLVPLGDCNGDSVVNFDDINPFVAAMVNRESYEHQYPNADWLNADTNGDGVVNFDDINPFVTCLVNGGCDQ